MNRALVLVGLTAIGAGNARADRYEASVHVQPSAGMASVGGIDTDERVTVPSFGLAVRTTYGVRHWIAAEAELGVASLGAAQFSDVPLTLGGGQPMTADVERTTRTARFTVGATLRFGVAWIPTVSAGLGAQLRQEGTGHVVGTELTPDGHGGQLRADALVFTRVGLDRRINRRLVVGVSVGASRAFASPAIESFDVTISIARYWYPLLRP